MTRLSLIPLCLTLATPAFAEWPAVAEPNGTLSGSIGDVPFDLPVYCNTDPMMPFYVVQSHENLSQSRGPSDGTVAAMVMFNAPYATVLIFTGAEDPYAFGLSGEPLFPFEKAGDVDHKDGTMTPYALNIMCPDKE